MRQRLIGWSKSPHAARSIVVPLGTRVVTVLRCLVLAVFVPLMLFATGTIWRSQETQRRQQEMFLVDQARETSRAVDWTFERVRNGLLSLAESSALGHGDLIEFGREMRRLSARLGSVPVTLMNVDGDVLQHVAELPAMPAENGPMRQALAKAMRDGGPMVSNLLAPEDPAHREVIVFVPVFRSGHDTADYMLAGAFDSERLDALSEAMPSNQTGSIFTIRDRNGVVVARPAQGDRQIDAPSAKEFLQAIGGRHSGPVAIDSLSTNNVPIRAFSTGPVSGYTVAVAAWPTSSIRRDLIALGLTGLTLLIIALFAAADVARGLADALSAAAGDRVKPSGLWEVDELTSRLHAASIGRDAAQTELRDSESRLRNLLTTLDLATVIVREFDGTIRFWSQGCVAMFGWTREQAVGRSVGDLLRTQFPVPSAQIDQALLTRGQWTGELIHRRRDGTIIVGAAQQALKRDLDGRPYRVVESVVNVTGLHEAQDALKTLNQSLWERVTNEVAAREAAQRRAADVDRIHDGAGTPQRSEG